MAALLRYGARRLGGSMLQRAQAAVTLPAVAEERHRLVPRRMFFADKRAPEAITLDIQRKQRELCDAIAEGKRSLRAATDWRTQQKLFDAIAKARRSLTAATDWCNEDLQEHFRRPKPHQIFGECIVLFFKVAGAIVEITFAGIILCVLVTIVCDLVREKQEEKAKKTGEAKKNRQR